MRGAIIPDAATAQRIGQQRVWQTQGARSYRVFEYEQPRTRLTLFGVVITYRDGREQEIRFQ